MKKVISKPEGNPLDIIAAIGVVAAALYMSGCGYALVPVPSNPGQRISLTNEQRMDALYRTAMDVAEDQVDPVNLLQRTRRR